MTCLGGILETGPDVCEVATRTSHPTFGMVNGPYAHLTTLPEQCFGSESTSGLFVSEQSGEKFSKKSMVGGQCIYLLKGLMEDLRGGGGAGM